VGSIDTIGDIVAPTGDISDWSVDEEDNLN
jgi:hypothetical protein